ncbi:dnaJ homolog subfamily C member 28-like [Diadema setosum]|uniref:dnaJ homolog subfamily C member 28-like n=1 Tax=Diadema setosum TaxID=31175 RepID=UPI003B3A94B1
MITTDFRHIGSRLCHSYHVFTKGWHGGAVLHLFHTSSAALGYRISQNVRDCYQLLNVSEKASIVEVKEAYFKLAKLYHPDSKSRQADGNKFNQVQEAYNTICVHMEKMEKLERRKGEAQDELGDRQEFDIKHTAPQHRQYLEYEGIGYGTPNQRQKQYQKHRAVKAADAVSSHRMYKIAMTDEKSLVIKDKRAARKIRTTNVIERLVEDLIQDSMARGEFDDLPGKGKPLPPKPTYCPYIDLSTHHLNQVLVNNGYAPEWIQREKEIRNSLSDAKKALLKERRKLGPEPLNDFNVKKWAGLQIEFEESVKEINKMVNDFNLIVPIIKLQMVHICPKKEIAKVVSEYDKIAAESSQQEPVTEPVQLAGDEVAVMAGKVFSSLSILLSKMTSLIFDREGERVKNK